MALIPKPLSLSRQTLGPDAKEAWIDRLAAALNPFFADVRQAITDLSGETHSKVITITTEAAVANSFPLQFKPDVEPSSVILVQVLPLSGNPAMTDPVSLTSWAMTSDGQVSIKFITGLPASTKLRLTLQYR